MHEYPVFGSSNSVSTQDYVKHKLRPGRLQSLQSIEVSAVYIEGL